MAFSNPINNLKNPSTGELKICRIRWAIIIFKGIPIYVLYQYGPLFQSDYAETQTNDIIQNVQIASNRIHILDIQKFCQNNLNVAIVKYYEGWKTNMTGP